MNIKIGQKVRFDPFDYIRGYGVDDLRSDVTGTVVEIHVGHRWFGVEYGNPKQRTAFKFSDIGKDVFPVG